MAIDVRGLSIRGQGQSVAVVECRHLVKSKSRWVEIGPSVFSQDVLAISKC